MNETNDNFSYLSISAANQTIKSHASQRELVNSSAINSEEHGNYPQNVSNKVSENLSIQELLNTLIELQKKSTKLESAIKQQGREIKIDILPDGYDKRMAPPSSNGAIYFNNIVTFVFCHYLHLVILSLFGAY